MTKKSKAWISLLRPPNLPTVPGDPLAGWFLAGGTGVPAAVAAAGAALLFYIAGLILNDVADIEIDRRERPERPLPSGIISRRAALHAGLLCGLAGLGVAANAGRAVLGAGALLLLAILAYTFVTPRGSAMGLLTMGLCALSVGLGITPPDACRRSALLAAAGIGTIAAVSWMAAGGRASRFSTDAAGCRAADAVYWAAYCPATPARAPIMLAIAATTLLRLALVTVKLGRRPAPGRMPQAVGSYIRLLLLLQATCCAARTEGLAVAAILIILMPVAAHLGRFYHAS